MKLTTFIAPFMIFCSLVLLMQGLWLAMPLRGILFIGARNLLHPGGASEFIGLGVGLPIYFWQRLRRTTA